MLQQNWTKNEPKDSKIQKDKKVYNLHCVAYNVIYLFIFILV